MGHNKHNSMKIHWGYVVLIVLAAVALTYGFANNWTFKRPLGGL